MGKKVAFGRCTRVFRLDAHITSLKKKMKTEKPFSKLDRTDLKKSAVWKFLPETDERDETWVNPVHSLPCSNLASCIVGIDVCLVNGRKLLAFLGNIDLTNKEASTHFLTITLQREDGQWFDLARYHDADVDRRGPTALASFLQLPVDKVFPITHDISAVAVGVPDILKGEIQKEPTNRLSQDELIQMALR